MKSYQQVLDYLYSQLPMYQRTGPAALKNDLGNTIKLDELFNHPHRAYKTIHVAGTNGKGSVSHMLASVLQEAGYRVGLYTSPHLVDFRERIRVNGQLIPHENVVQFIEEYQLKNIEPNIEPSFFELTMMMAFDYFRKAKVDVAVIEVGLGGRLDSTNIIRPEVSVITNISMDHMALLGNTIPKIAAEKAGIIKSNVPVVISESNPEYNEVFETKAREMNAPLYYAENDIEVRQLKTDLIKGIQTFKIKPVIGEKTDRLSSDMLGDYQQLNIGGVLKTLQLLVNQGWNVQEDSIVKGIASIRRNTGLRGRWEIAGRKPTIICDTGHNPGGVALLSQQLTHTQYKNLYIVWGMVSDKSVEEVLRLLPSNATFIFTQAGVPRAMKADLLGKIAESCGLTGQIIPNVKLAVNKAVELANEDDLIFVGGSTFVVADFFS